jgi:hypothetical protein
MAQAWEGMTADDKIEDLRKDVTRIFRIFTEMRDAIAQDQYAVRAQIEVMKPWGPFLNQLQQRIEKLGG